MTYEEFKDTVEALSIYKLVDTGHGSSDIYLEGYYEDDDLMGSVSHEHEYTMDIAANCLTDMLLIETMLEYVLTPIEDR